MEFHELEDLDQMLEDLTVPGYSLGVQNSPLSIGYQSETLQEDSGDELLKMCFFSPGKGPEEVARPQGMEYLDLSGQQSLNFYPSGQYTSVEPSDPHFHDFHSSISSPVGISSSSGTVDQPKPTATVADLFLKTKIFTSKADNRERKSYREKQRRMQVNKRFDSLAKCLEENPKKEKADLIQTAIEEIERLRAENQMLKAQLSSGHAKTVFSSTIPEQKTTTADPMLTKQSCTVRVGQKRTRPARGAQRPLVPMIVSDGMKKSKVSSGTSMPSFDLSKIAGLEQILKEKGVLPPPAVLAKMITEQVSLSQASTSEEVTHSQCA